MVPSPVWIEVPRYSRALPVTNEIYSKKATAATTKGPAENEGAVEEMRVFARIAVILTLSVFNMLRGVHKLTVLEEPSGRGGRLCARRAVKQQQATKYCSRDVTIGNSRRPYQLPDCEPFAMP